MLRDKKAQVKSIHSERKVGQSIVMVISTDLQDLSR